MAGCGGARWGTEQWLFVCCSFLWAVIIAPPPLKMASRLSIMQVGAHVHAFMLPQECIHAPATCLWWKDVWFFCPKIWKWVPCYLLCLAIYKRFSDSENVGDFFCFSGSGDYSARRCATFSVRGKGKDRQAPERNWTCSYTTTGSWQRLGKRLGSPGEAWSQSRPSCARRWNRHAAPPLSSTSALASVIQLLLTTADLFSDILSIRSPFFTPFHPTWNVGGQYSDSC